MMTDQEKMFNLLIDTRKMIIDRQRQHEENGKKGGPASKKTHGNKARECCDILEEMTKLLNKYEAL